MKDENTNEMRYTGWEKVLICLAVISFVGGVLAGFILGHGLVEGLGVFGVGVTLAAVFLSLMIYLNQRRAAVASEKRMTSHVTSVVERVGSGAEEEEEPEQADAFPEEYAALGAPVPGNQNVRQLAPGEVPLQLIYDLVSGWSQAGAHGSWKIGSLVTVLRRAGKGNHAWWFVFERPDGRRLLKLTKGGRGKASDAVSVIDMTE